MGRSANLNHVTCSWLHLCVADWFSFHQTWGRCFFFRNKWTSVMTLVRDGFCPRWFLYRLTRAAIENCYRYRKLSFAQPSMANPGWLRTRSLLTRLLRAHRVSYLPSSIQYIPCQRGLYSCFSFVSHIIPGLRVFGDAYGKITYKLLRVIYPPSLFLDGDHPSTSLYSQFLLDRLNTLIS